MSFLMAQPEILTAASRELHRINASVREGNSAVAISTTRVTPAAADAVSILTAQQFSRHGQLFQEISAQAALIREQLATMLGISAGSYGATEVANTASVG
ncbi:PE family protein [Mycobacterium sp. 852002-51971_SCH5477799-a]|uniref:PE family protein n=1 Tax=Mycobacterium sp. 852002-51971_SCH5477799-a TaxID=1834106 RepID=UPI0007FDB33C|nr:PE family protein [Mycobacterium sp. 852002-51971_SCH5477799-a]OBF61037.1 PE family protein [Mycobacterium sp. 852002-51971_SCH5477799-a]